MCVESKDGGAARGVVAADALECRGAVLHRVREHVDVGLVPSDELAISPDPVGRGQFAHVGALKRVYSSYRASGSGREFGGQFEIVADRAVRLVTVTMACYDTARCAMTEEIGPVVNGNESTLMRARIHDTMSPGFSTAGSHAPRGHATRANPVKAGDAKLRGYSPR